MQSDEYHTPSRIMMLETEWEKSMVKKEHRDEREEGGTGREIKEK